MSFLGRLFGSNDTIKKAADGIYNGVDMAFFTTEEKSQHFLELLRTYEPYKLAQRLLMLVVCPAYVFMQVVAVCLFAVGLFMPACTATAPCTALHLMDGAQQLSAMVNTTLGQGFAIILAFYFGGGAVEGIVRAARKRKD